MRCPVDQDVELAMSSREGVEIDYCPKCRGVWLDRGELDKIIERSADELRGDDRRRGDDRDRDRAPRFDERRYQGGHGDKPKKRESFFERVFDFD